MPIWALIVVKIDQIKASIDCDGIASGNRVLSCDSAEGLDVDNNDMDEGDGGGPPAVGAIALQLAEYMQ